MHSKIICILDDEEREALQKVADIKCSDNMECKKCPLKIGSWCARNLCATVLEREKGIYDR